MGWGFGELPNGKKIGYSVSAVCEEPGCDAAIDRGLAYACGGMHGEEENYCAGYFCYEHLFFSDDPYQQGTYCRCCCREHERRA